MNKGISEVPVKRLSKLMLILACVALAVSALAACTGLVPVTDNRVQAAAPEATPAPVVEPADATAGAPLRPPLVACNEAGNEGQPCWLIATEPADIVGIWKQYMGNPRINAPNGMAFIQYRPDGTFSMADTPENTDAPLGIYPHGTYQFDGDNLTILVDNVPPDCAGPAIHQVRVLQLDGRPIGIRYYAIKDDCAPRRADFGELLLWAGE